VVLASRIARNDLMSLYNFVFISRFSIRIFSSIQDQSARSPISLSDKNSTNTILDSDYAIFNVTLNIVRL
jgi:hypothetical protein